MLRSTSGLTVGQLRKYLEEYQDSDEITFGSGNLTFYRVKRRGDDLAQIDFNEDTSQLPQSALLNQA